MAQPKRFRQTTSNLKPRQPGYKINLRGISEKAVRPGDTSRAHDKL